MNIIKMIVLLINLVSIVYLQNDSGVSTSASMGSVTLDGKIYNQVAIRPEIPIGKLGIGLDLYVYFNDEGLYPGNWEFSNDKALQTIVDKIYFIRWGKPEDNLFFKIGALPNVTLGQGILVNNYSNTMEYPEVRRIGFNLKTRLMEQFGIELIHSNLKKSTPGLLASRISYDPFPRLSFGVSYVTDLDQNQGLKDRDGDNYPDYFDHYPNDKDRNNEAWEIYKNNQEFWDGTVSGDGIVDSSLVNAGLNYNYYNPNFSTPNDDISGLSVDLILRLSKKTYLYSQFAQLIGETKNVNENDPDLGWGFVPVGLSTKLGPVNFRSELRISKENFIFSYWDQVYDLNRAIAQGDEIITKESQLYRYGDLQGFYMDLGLNMFELINFGIAYQNMSGKVWDDASNNLIDDVNQTLIGKVSINTDGIPKLDLAEAYYQQSNVKNPFDFDPNEATIFGYNLGFEVSAGMTLVYKNRTSYILDSDGIFVPEPSMQIETQIKF